MDERNNNSVNNMIPQEIPIPDIDGTQEAAVQPEIKGQPADTYGNPNVQNQPNNAYGNANVQDQFNNAYGNANAQNQQNDAYENPYAQNQPGNTYGNPYAQNQQNNMYGNPNQFYGQPVQPYQPRGRRKSGKALIIAACVVAVLVILGVAARAYYTGRPLYKIAKGLMNLSQEFGEVKNPLVDKVGIEDIMAMMKEEGSHVKTKMNFTTDTFLGSTTLGIDTDLYKDMRAKELDSSTAVSIMNYEMAHLDLYGNEEMICFSIPELFMEDMYFNTENVVSQYNNSILSDDEMFGKADIEDFSIELFPEDEDRISIGDWRSVSGYMERYDEAMAACRENMTVEKADKGVYRLTCQAKDVDRLVREMLESSEDLYVTQDGELELLKEYDQLVASDVSILFAINNQNKIESITLENPVELLDGDASVNGEIFFLGEERSIDTIQGKITITNVYEEKTEVICQVVQTLEKDDYQVGMDLKYTADESDGKMKFTMECDASKDTFDMTFSMKDDIDTLEVTAEGSLDDIVKGESFALELEDFTVNMDGEKLCTITGDIEVEPLKEKITPGVEAKTAIFEMTYEDVGDIAYKLAMEYGSLLDLLDY